MCTFSDLVIMLFGGSHKRVQVVKVIKPKHLHNRVTVSVERFNEFQGSQRSHWT